MTWALNMQLKALTGGHHIYFVPIPNIEDGLKVALAIFMLAMYANLLIKISIALMLLRIKDSRRWKIGLWTLIGSAIAIGVSLTIVELLQCRPLKGFWEIELRATSHCFSTHTDRALIYFWGSKYKTDVVKWVKD
jgi:hypothetical protein